jgi:hypothetical protein
MAMSADSDLTALQPDILTYGISAFTSEHARAKADIERELRIHWWPFKNISGEMNATLLTESQFTRCAAYRVLGWYALPQLTKWEASGNEDRYQQMMKFYRDAYSEELERIVKDGVEYDADEDSSISTSEKTPLHFGRQVR